MPKVFGGVPDQTAFQDMLEKQGGTSDFTWAVSASNNTVPPFCK